MRSSKTIEGAGIRAIAFSLLAAFHEKTLRGAREENKGDWATKTRKHKSACSCFAVAARSTTQRRDGAKRFLVPAGSLRLSAFAW
jgi:hypothetical protein